MPADTDYTHPRPPRFIMMDFSDAAPGVDEADYNASLDKHIQQVLALPGWMAAQKLEFVGRTGAKPELPRHLVIWEIEGPAQAAQDAVTAATAATRIELRMVLRSFVVQAPRVRRTQAVLASRAAIDSAASGAKSSKRWKPPGQTWSSARPPAAHSPVA